MDNVWYKKIKILDYANNSGKTYVFGKSLEDSNYYVWHTHYNVFEPIPSENSDIYKSTDSNDAYSYFSECIGSNKATVNYKAPKSDGAYYNKSTSNIDFQKVDKNNQVSREYSLFKSLQDNFLQNAKRHDYVTFDDTTYVMGNVKTPNYEEWRVWFTKSSPNEKQENAVKYVADSLNFENATKIFKAIVNTEKKKSYRRYLDSKIEFLEKNF